jgi:hypothetical protein
MADDDRPRLVGAAVPVASDLGGVDRAGTARRCQLGEQLLERRSDPGLSLIHITEPTRLLSISYAVIC